MSRSVCAPPRRPPQGQPVRVGERVLHRRLSSARIVGEHVIAGGKRGRIVQEVWRLTKADIADRVMELACGLPTLRVSWHHPLPGFALLHLMSFA